MGLGRREVFDEAIAGLTDAELLERYWFAIRQPGVTTSDQLIRIEAEYQASPTAEALARLNRARSEFTKPNMEMRYLYAEIGERQGVMLKKVRQDRGLSVREALIFTNTFNASHRSWLLAIEHSEWRFANASAYEKACTEGRLDANDPAIIGTFWVLLVGHPYCRTIREVAVEHSWLSNHEGAAVSLARSIHKNRSFDRLPELGEALQASGCNDREILDHCRNPGFHAVGCWVVDTLIRAGRSA